MEIKVKEEYASLLPQSSDEEFEQLKQSIQTHGLHAAIVIAPDGTLLDGHNRLRACRELGIEPKLVVKKFETPEEEAIFVLESNIRRRQLSTVERIKLVHERLEPLERELAKRRQVAPLKTGGKAPLSLSSPDNNGPSGRTVEKMAEAAGTSPATYARTVTVLENAPPEVKEKMVAGEMTPGEAHRVMKGEKKPKKEREVKDFVLLPASLFEQASVVIAQARADGTDKIRLLHDGHAVLELAA